MIILCTVPILTLNLNALIVNQLDPLDASIDLRLFVWSGPKLTVDLLYHIHCNCVPV